VTNPSQASWNSQFWIRELCKKTKMYRAGFPLPANSIC